MRRQFYQTKRDQLMFNLVNWSCQQKSTVLYSNWRGPWNAKDEKESKGGGIRRIMAIHFIFQPSINGQRLILFLSWNSIRIVATIAKNRRQICQRIDRSGRQSLCVKWNNEIQDVNFTKLFLSDLFAS